MEPSDWAGGLAVVVVVAVLVGSGPLAGGLIRPSGTPTMVGDGNATATEVAVPTEEFVVSPGRFGTDVAYLRVPDARVDLSSVTGQPRLVYRIEVPALDPYLKEEDDPNQTVSQIVTAPGSYRLHQKDFGLRRNALSRDSYNATVTVHVQSFAMYRTIYRRNVTVEVRP